MDVQAWADQHLQQGLNVALVLHDAARGTLRDNTTHVLLPEVEEQFKSHFSPNGVQCGGVRLHGM